MTESKRFGRFKTDGVLGRGGMGTVYQAHDPLIGRTIAIKELRLDAAFSTPERAEIEARFEQEFRAAGRLSHPNIVTIYDVGSGDGSYFIAMEYIEGDSLDQRLRGAPMPASEVLKTAQQIASGLDYAHDQGIVHRDIKPANILFDEGGNAKITDFGVAKLRSAQLTQTGRTVGTPAFMAPEQILGQPVNGRADQFSLAVILYLMLTGSQPFAGEHPSSVLYRIVHEEPQRPQLKNHALPSPVDEVLLHALAKAPSDRFSSCSEMVAALAEALGAQQRQALGTPADPSASILVTQPIDTHHVLDQRPPADLDLGLEIGAANEPQVIAERARATAGSGHLVRNVGLGLALLAMSATTTWWWFGGGATDSAEPTNKSTDTPTTAATVDPGLAATAAPAEQAAGPYRLPVISEIEGAAIWRDGVDSGLVTPAEIELDGELGSEIRLAVRDGQRLIAERTFVLGAELPPAWNASPPAQRLLTVTTAPAGARLLIDGVASEQLTPAEITFERHREYQLELQLDGYHPASWVLDLDHLDDSQAASGRLHLPLRQVIPAGVIAIDANFPIAVRVAGKRWPAAERQRIDLPPGDYRIELVAEAFFFRQTYQVALRSGEHEKLAVPVAYAVRIVASPANCQVSIDGQVVDFTPIHDRRLAAGEHEFLFDWPRLQRSKRITIDINQPAQRIFVAAP